MFLTCVSLKLIFNIVVFGLIIDYNVAGCICDFLNSIVLNRWLTLCNFEYFGCFLYSDENSIYVDQSRCFKKGPSFISFADGSGPMS